MFHSLLDDGSGVYVEQLRLPLRGKLDTTAFAAAWQAVADTHAVFRTAVVVGGGDDPYQIEVDRIDLPVEQHDLRHRGADADAVRAAERARGFDLARPPLARVALLRLDDDEWEAVLTHHHLLLDGWSAGMVLDDLLSAYASLHAGTTPRLAARPPFRAYAEWLRDHPPAGAPDHWRRLLAGFAEPTPLPGAQAVEGEHGTRALRRALPSDVADAIRVFARGHRVTVGTCVHGAWAAALARSANVDDVVYGATVSARPPEIAGSESIVGLLINTLPVRVRVRDDALVAEWLAGVQDQLATVVEVGGADPAEPRRWSAVAAGRPLFDSIVAFENFPSSVPADPVGGVVVGEPETVDSSNYPLALAAAASLADEGPFDLVLHHDTSVIDGATAAAVLDHVVDILTALPDAATLADLPRPEPSALSNRRTFVAPRRNERSPVRDGASAEAEAVLARIWATCSVSTSSAPTTASSIWVATRSPACASSPGRRPRDCASLLATSSSSARWRVSLRRQPRPCPRCRPPPLRRRRPRRPGRSTCCPSSGGCSSETWPCPPTSTWRSRSPRRTMPTPAPSAPRSRR
nr:condensation domain-containing protein [uncultured bacterium]